MFGCLVIPGICSRLRFGLSVNGASDRLDDISVDNVKMDARWQNTDMERMKVEAEQDVPKDVVESQAEMVVNLVGIVGRRTVMIGEAGRLLRSSVEEGRDGDGEHLFVL